VKVKENSGEGIVSRKNSIEKKSRKFVLTKSGQAWGRGGEFGGDQGPDKYQKGIISSSIKMSKRPGPTTENLVKKGGKSNQGEKKKKKK